MLSRALILMTHVAEGIPRRKDKSAEGARTLILRPEVRCHDEIPSSYSGFNLDAIMTFAALFFTR